MFAKKHIILKNKHKGKFKVFVVTPVNSELPPTQSEVFDSEKCHAEKTQASSRCETVITTFLRYTTIPGLNQLGNSKEWYLKCMWILVFITGVGMAVYQSESLIMEYKKYSVLQRATYEIQQEMDFPSVTACISIPIRWRQYPHEDMDYDVYQQTLARILALPKHGDQELDNAFSPEENILLDELLNLSGDEMSKLNYPLDMFVLSCNWRDTNCKSQLLHFHNLYYGSCFTFNPGLDSNITRTSADTLNIVLRTQFNDAFNYTRRDDGPVLMIHPPGTAPHLERRKLYTLYPGRWLKIGVTQTIIERLPEPYSSKCIDGKSKEYQERILGYNADTPYLYTFDTCMTTCEQDLSITICNCVNSFYPLPEDHPNQVCLFYGCANASSEAGRSCKCRKPCQDISYTYLVEADDRWLKQRTWWNWVANLLKMKHAETVEINTTVGFEVYLYSMNVATIREEPMILWADFLGSIGGNLSLWVGLSVISLVEIVELFRKFLFEVIIQKCFLQLKLLFASVNAK